MKRIYFLFVCFFSSCSQNIEPAQKISVEDSLISTLLGKWGGSSESQPSWEIKKDSLFYFEYSRAYPYKIVGHDMVVNLPDSSQMKWVNIHVIKDTLLFDERPGWTVQAVKFK